MRRLWRTICAHRIEAAIWVAFVALASIYSVATPVFEASDELSHFPVIDHIADTGRLPVQRPGVETPWHQEGSQPPLYYLVGALLVRGIDRGDMERLIWVNPHAKIGVALPADNKNMIIHTEAEHFPWRGTVLAVHLLRFFSVALGAVTVALTPAVARLAAPGHSLVPRLAMALTALNPMFLFITGSVNNDNLTVALTTAALLLSLLILRDGLRARWVILLSVTLALASLSKISGLAFYPLAVLVLLIVVFRDKGAARRVPMQQKLTTAIGACSILVVAWLVIAGWWYWRNVTLYNEPLGLQTMIAIARPRVPMPSYLDLLAEFEGFRIAYWGLFGAVNVLISKPFYVFADALTALALAGLAWWAFRQTRAQRWSALLPAGLLALQIAVVFAGVVNWTRQTPASQGRLLFPAIAAISALLALGLVGLLHLRWRRMVVLAVTASLALVALVSPFLYIAPAYAPPPVIDSIPDGAHPVEVHWGPVELLAYQVHEEIVFPGGEVPVTFYWRATETIDADYSLYLHLLGREHRLVGKIDTHPGRGLLPTSRWTPGAVIADTYRVPASDLAAQTPTMLRLAVGWWRYPDAHSYLTPITADGVRLPDLILDLNVGLLAHDYTKQPDLPNTPGATFGGAFVLRRYTISNPTPKAGGGFDVTLYWESRADGGESYTVFVHLIDAGGTIRGQGDGPPVHGDFPTSLWQRGQWIEDAHTVAIDSNAPPGDYTLSVGLYRPGDGSRLEVHGANSDRLPDDAFVLEQRIKVNPP